MSVKEFDIEIPKLDHMIISLSIKNKEGENVRLDNNDLLFMSVRTKERSEDYEFQKSLENGIVYNTETNKYEIEINFEDTEHMTYNKEYGYDITVYYDGNKPKQLLIGNFTITTKYTLNEVV